MLEERSVRTFVTRLDLYVAEELGCPPQDLERSGVHVIASDRRARAGWGGYTMPIVAVSTPLGGVISCRPDLAPAIGRDLNQAIERSSLTMDDFEALRRIGRRAVPYAYSLGGFAMCVEPGQFRPLVGQVERLLPTDARGRDLRRRFDGEIFVVSGTRGEIAAWSAIKLRTDDVWEIAVVTEAPYRGRGLAKQVVSASTGYVIEQGRLALYVHDRTNLASARVCRSLGYVEHSRMFFCEY